MPTEAKMTDLYATLDSMDGNELRLVQRRIEGMISGYDDRKRREALSAAEQIAKEHGFKLNDLLGDGASVKGRQAASGKSPAPAKYANPDDPQQTWSGRGRRPAWVREALDADRSLSDLAI